jgi:predicted hydrocarbon binding protein
MTGKAPKFHRDLPVNICRHCNIEMSIVDEWDTLEEWSQFPKMTIRIYTCSECGNSRSHVFHAKKDRGQ